jgi:cation diffusion facilitator CzcD-associated flavoprotein CzcO
VLVVGSGCSGMEIAYDLAAGGAAPVRLSVRAPLSIVLRSMGGLPGDLPAMVLLRLPPRVGDSQVRVLQRLVLGDLTAHGLPVPTEGAFARLRRLGVAPTVVDRQVVQAIRDRRIQVVSGLEALDTTGATLADGTRVEPDVVVAATGYRRGLERPSAVPKSIASGRQGPRPKLTTRHEMGGKCEERDEDGHGPWPGRARWSATPWAGCWRRNTWSFIPPQGRC